MRELILASQSPQRLEILKTLNNKFRVLPAHLDEKKAAAGVELNNRAETIALAKAQVISRSFPEAAVIAADTFVVLGKEVLEKPETLVEARAMLKQQSNHWLNVHTGFCYLDLVTKQSFSGNDIVKTKFRKLSSEEIDLYVENEPVLTWSGAFCPAYATGAALIDRIQGSFNSFVYGLPIEKLVKMIKQSGF